MTYSPADHREIILMNAYHFFFFFIGKKGIIAALLSSFQANAEVLFPSLGYESFAQHCQWGQRRQDAQLQSSKAQIRFQKSSKLRMKILSQLLTQRCSSCLRQGRSLQRLHQKPTVKRRSLCVTSTTRRGHSCNQEHVLDLYHTRVFPTSKPKMT